MEPLLLSCIESRVENSRNLYGRFKLGPFVLGQGVTIANSLRRSLLSEISGLAITAVEIEGVAHEYSTIEGIRESVLDILLNIKQIVLTSDFQIQEPQVAFLQVQGPGIVRAKDIKLPISIQSVDPEQYIATLLYDGLLKIKFMICRGKNYLVQTPLGLYIPNSPRESYKKQESPFLELNAKLYLTKSSNTLTSHTDKSSPNTPYTPDTSPNIPNGIRGLLPFTDKSSICKPDIPLQTEGLYQMFGDVSGGEDLSVKGCKGGVSVLPPKSERKNQIKDVKTSNKDSDVKKVIGLAQKEGLLLSSDLPFFPKERSERSERSEGSTRSKKQNINFNPFLSKKSNESFFASFLQMEDLQDHQQEEKSVTLTHHKPLLTESDVKGAHDMSESNSDVTVDLSNTSQNEKKISSVYSTNSEETLLNNNKTELSFFNTLYEASSPTNILTSPKVMLEGDVKMLKGGVTISKKKNTIDSKIPQKQKKGWKKTGNILPIDAVFMPINRVNFAIELNNESQAPKDLVILEVWTNGSIHPKQAINEAAKALIQLITPFQETQIFKSVFINSPKVLQRTLSSSNIETLPSKITYGDVSMLEGDGSTTLENMNLLARTKKNIKLLPHLPAKGLVKNAKQETALFSEGKHRNSLLNKNIAFLDIGDLDLSLRPYTCLKRANIETVADLLSYSAEDLLNLKNFGKRSLSEIEQNLNQMGLKLHS